MVTYGQIRLDWSHESPKETIPGGAAGKRGTVDKFAAAVVQSFVAAAAESVGCSAVAAAAVVLVEAVEAVEIRGRRELDA